MTSIIHNSKYNFDESKEINAWGLQREMCFLYMFTELGLLESTIEYLEIGSLEGASVCWVRENTDKRSRLTTIDIYELPTLLNNLRTADSDFSINFIEGDSADVLPRLIDAGKLFDVIYVDGDHEYDGVTSDLKNSEKLLSEGGVLVMDDYSEKSWPGVYAAVNDWITDDWDILFDQYMLWLRKKC